MDATECVNCFQDTGFNRVIVRESTGDVMGGLCESCECDILDGGVSEFAGDDGESSCCGSSARFAAPLLDLLIESEDGYTVKDVEYTIERSTPRLCLNHYHEMVDEELSQLVTV